ncbi:hypothetical protein KJ682_11220 [bacterium]|nr:hypothetical protein [bacterium]
MFYTRLFSSATWRMPSSLTLVLANTVPLFGVLLLGWEVFPLLFLFWAEGVVIGAFHVLKMLAARPTEWGHWFMKVILVPFFFVHYGMFAAGHVTFLIQLFGGEGYSDPGFPPDPAVLLGIIERHHLVWPVAAFVVSHGVSFFINYLGKGEFRRMVPVVMFMAPYARVVVMHLTLFAGGFLMMRAGDPTGGLVALVVLKTILDLGAHLRERRKMER